jgi:hypothetical protein
VAAVTDAAFQASSGDPIEFKLGDRTFRTIPRTLRASKVIRDVGRRFNEADDQTKADMDWQLEVVSALVHPDDREAFPDACWDNMTDETAFAEFTAWLVAVMRGVDPTLLMAKVKEQQEAALATALNASPESDETAPSPSS